MISVSQQPYQTGGQRSGSQQIGRLGGGQQFGGRQGGGQQFGGQSGMGQQFGGQRGPTGQGGVSQAGGEGLAFDDVITGEMRVALTDFARSIEVCEWCADQCIAEANPQMVECIRLCRDVADIAALNVQLLGRQSPSGPGIAEEFLKVARACADECSRHSEAHCQECARVLRRAVQSTEDLLRSVQSGTVGQRQTMTA